MKPEPLKDKKIEREDDGKEIIEDNYFYVRDILSAVEWLKEQLCDCDNISDSFPICYTCKQIDKAFPDVIKNGKKKISRS